MRSGITQLQVTAQECCCEGAHGTEVPRRRDAPPGRDGRARNKVLVRFSVVTLGSEAASHRAHGAKS